jgi:class 3 adenylate cyclase
VEHLTREIGDIALVTEATRCLLSDDEEELEPRGDFALKGVSEPVPIYAVPLRVDESLRWVSRAPQAEA